MRKISLCLFIFVFTVSLARAQDSATQDQIDQINGKIQDIEATQALQNKRIAALEKAVGDLSDKLNQPGGNNFASADDLKSLAAQVQEIDKKRQEDNDRILKELERLDKSLGVAPSSHQTAPSTSEISTDVATSSGPQKGYDYKIQDKDTLSAIARAYSAKGIKVTVDQILKANPGLNPKNLIVGKKIFIPDPNAK
jgi:septal ring factor EnvC (AmiA/AmiB activator)